MITKAKFLETPGCVALTANDLTVGWSNFSSLKSLPRLFPRTEVEWTETLRELQENMVDLHRTRSRSSEPAILALAIPSIVLPCKARDAGDGVLGMRKLEEIVLQGMRRLARVYPDPVIKAEWGTRAEEFAQFLLISDDEESCC
ncbi:hypothetical protein ACEPAI_1455 [Sanghuangporus weigelae]